MHDHETQTLSNIHPDFQCQFPWPSNYSSCNFSSQNWEIVWIWNTRCTHYHEAQDPPVIGNIKPDLHADFRGPPTTLAITFPQKTWEQMDLPTSHANVRAACVFTKLGRYSHQQHSTSPTCQYLLSSNNSSCNFSPNIVKTNRLVRFMRKYARCGLIKTQTLQSFKISNVTFMPIFMALWQF